jgi:arginyl-tRNA synthetase
MKTELEQTIAEVVKTLFDEPAVVELTRPDEQFGDYATNVALQLAGTLHQSPRGVAETIASELRNRLADQVKTVTVAGPGFINITLTDRTVAMAAASAFAAKSHTYKGQVVVAEYSDANPFKVMHAGHVYTTVVGDAIAMLLEYAGATVHRVNFGGDVGLHVGKTMWAILQALDGEHPAKLAAIPVEKRAEWLSEQYVIGNNTYEDNEAAKEEVVALNKRVYQLHADNDHTSPFAEIYWTCRQWSYEAFDAFFARFGTKLEKYYPESEVADLGVKAVKEHLGTVFEESDGAIVFKGEPYGLHTRVFINRHGLPTYEAKDVGLIAKKYEDYHFDRSIVLTDYEQQEYMAVVQKAIEQFWPHLAQASQYIPHNKLKLAGGTKMSSRKGNIVRALAVLDMTAAALKAAGRQPDDVVVLGAVKYAFLKHRIGGDDIIYDPKESISLDGNSGPYLQYAHARARSILRKADFPEGSVEISTLETGERSLARKVSEYPEVVHQAVIELMPHHICTYLYELAQTFNRFYEHNRVVGSERQDVRLSLVQSYADTLKAGLCLIGITAPDTM